MEMTTFSFLLYFLPAMVLVYYALFFSKAAQNYWLVLCCVAFLLINNAISLLYLLAYVITLNYFLGYVIQKSKDNEKSTKGLIVFGYIANLLPLLGLKYVQPAVNSIAALLGGNMLSLPIAPLGISFLALQGISYITDIRRGTVQWDSSVANSALYFAFFPPLYAGPILRYGDIAPQIRQREMRFDNVIEGLCRFIVGLAKLVLLAQPIMAITDIVFGQSNLSGVYATVPVSMALLGLGACILGVYYHLSGYSDLVIGLGRMLGFTYAENFDYPILASSVSNFWNRFFLSLTTWFDEYVYRPLGKNRTNNDKMVYHTALMWLLIGLWIGPGIPKVILAIWTALFIIVERIIDIDERRRSPWRQLALLVYLVIAAIAYKTDSLYHFTLFISNLLGMKNNGFQSSHALLLLKENWLPFAVGVLCCFPIGARLRRYSEEHSGIGSGIVGLAYPLAMIILVALVVLSLSGTSYDPYQILYSYLWS